VWKTDQSGELVEKSGVSLSPGKKKKGGKGLMDLTGNKRRNALGKGGNQEKREGREKGV